MAHPLQRVPPGPRAQQFATPFALYLLIGGTLSLAGWIFDVPRLAAWQPGGIAIQPNAAVATLLSGTAVALLLWGRIPAASALGGLLAALGLATLFQHVTGIDLGIDRRLLFDRPWGADGTVVPGRMGVPSSVSWALVGLSVLLHSRPHLAGRFSSPLALIVSLLATLSIVGYLFGADPLFALPRLTAIALQTATFLLAAGLALLLINDDREPVRTLMSSSAAGKLARRTLPMVVGLPLVLSYLEVKGQELGWYDAQLGTALLALLVVALIAFVLWRGLHEVDERERALVLANDDRNRAARALRENERRLTQMLEQLPVGVGVVDADGRWTMANALMRGWTEEHIPSRDPKQRGRWRTWSSDGTLLHPSAWPGARALRGETVRAVDFLRADERGRECWIRTSAAPFRDEAGDITGAVLVMQDVDAEKRADDALVTTARQFRLVADHAPVLLAHCDHEARFLFVNRAYAERFGMTPNEVVGRRIPEIVGAAAYRAFSHHVDAVLAGHSVTFEADIPYERGGTQHMHAAYVPERADNGKVVGFVAAIVNITARREAERALEASQRQLRQQAEELVAADRRKDEFLATLAHELRNPLAPIRTGLQVLARSPGDSAVATRLRQTMERQVEHLVRLIDDLLDVSRITRDRILLVRASVNLGDIVRQAVEACRPAIDASGHQLVLDLSTEALVVDGDEARLVQVVSNLLSNAATYTPRGGRITVRTARRNERATLSVSDTGIGIEGEMLPRIFERFMQATRTDEHRSSGLGLGLFIVRNLVELHGGSVNVESQGAGHGTTFRLTLPLADAKSTPTAAVSPALPEQVSAQRILVVDDNEDAADALAILLRHDGHHVEVANDGDTALLRAAAARFDAVLLDIGMGGMSGLEVCRRLRESPHGKDVLAVAITGWGQEEDRRRSREAGFDAHLVKPVAHSAVMELLAARSARHEHPAPR